jgi:DNA primase
VSHDDPIVSEIRARLVSPQRVVAALGLEGRPEGGRAYKVSCPWHKERSPSCNVRLGPDGSLQIHCFGCGRGGDVFSLIAAVRGLELPQDFAEVKREAADMANVSLDAPRSGATTRFALSSPVRSAPPPSPPRPAPALPGPPTPAETMFDAGARLLLTACPLEGSIACGLSLRGLLAEARADGWGELPVDLRKTEHEARRDVAEGYDAEHLGQAELVGRLRGDLSKLRWIVRGCRIVKPDHRLLIPWRSPDGRVNELQRRWASPNGDGAEKPPKGEPKYLFPAGNDYEPQAHYAYGADRVRELEAAAEVWLVEGAVDVLALRALNAGSASPRALAVLGIPGVTRWKQVRAGVLGYLRGRIVRVALDNDPDPKPGVIEAAEQITIDAYRAGAAEVHRTLPPRGKDWGEYAAEKLMGAA